MGCCESSLLRETHPEKDHAGQQQQQQQQQPHFGHHNRRAPQRWEREGRATGSAAAATTGTTPSAPSATAASSPASWSTPRPPPIPSGCPASATGSAPVSLDLVSSLSLSRCSMLLFSPSSGRSCWESGERGYAFRVSAAGFSGLVLGGWLMVARLS